MAEMGKHCVNTLLWTLFALVLLCESSNTHDTFTLSEEELQSYVRKGQSYIEINIAEPVEIADSSRSRRSLLARNLHAASSRRTRRHVAGSNSPRHFEINAFGETYQILLNTAKGLVREGLEAEYLGSDGRTVRREPIRVDCYYQGTLVFPEVFNDGNSSVGVNLCDGLTGVISTPEYDLIIQPLHADHADRYRRESRQDPSTTRTKRDAGNIPNNPHIVIKREAGADLRPGSGNTTEAQEEAQGETDESANVNSTDDDVEREHFCGLDTSYFHTLFNHTTSIPGAERVEQSSDNGNRKRRETGEPKAMELLVVADNQMRLYHGPDVVAYTLTLINIAAGRYQHQTLGRVLYFHIVRLLIMTTDSIVTQEGVTLDVVVDGEMTLSSFCSFQYYTNDHIDDHQDHWDNAILITRNDIELVQNKYVLGIANLRSACSLTHQCSYNEDIGLATGFIITHEIGHTVGMYHDSDVGCSGSGNVMSSSLTSGPGSFVWSSCSRDQLDAFIDYPHITCLDDIPEELNADFADEVLPGQVYDADEQCLLYSPYFSGRCTDVALQIYNIQDRCPQMYCRFPSGLCSRTAVATADGTECGDSKWCIEGACVDRPQTPINGGWSAWDAAWGICSRTCGGGVRLRYRYCDNPEPKNGGAACDGEDIVAEMCNTRDCETTQREFRDEQCSGTGDSGVRDGQVLSWTSTTDNLSGDELCELWCEADIELATGETLRIIDRRGDAYVDGTRCAFEIGTTSTCVNGTCRNFGCDGYQYSGLRADRCGVCGGNGSSCQRTEESFQQTLADQQFLTFLTIPERSTSVTVINSNSSTVMGVTINGEFVVGGLTEGRLVEGEYRAQNTTVFYNPTPGQETIMITEMTQYEVAFQVFAVGTGSAYADVWYEYHVTDTPPSPTTPSTTQAPPLFIWAKSDGECSVTCGAGTRIELVRCVNVIDVQFVEDDLCDSKSRPVPLTDSCQLDDCPPRWFLADLNSTCSATCGAGVRTRAVVCLQFAVDGVVVVNDSFCVGAEKPTATEPCTDLPDCQGTWVLSPWTECQPCQNRTRLALCRTGADFLTQLDDAECPDPKPYTWEPCECVTTTTVPTTEALSEGTTDPMMITESSKTTLEAGGEATPIPHADDNYLTTSAEGVIDRIRFTEGALSSIVVAAPLNHVVSVLFQQVNIDCSSGDLFRVKDEESVYSACNAFTNFNWTSSCNVLQFDLITHGIDRGYFLSYRFFHVGPSSSDCDQLFLEARGLLTSPNFPSFYPADQRCKLYIVAPPDHRINLYFDYFNLHDDDALLCSTAKDHVQIKDLDQRYFSSIYCGQRVPFGFISTGNRVRLSFFSDSMYTAAGFSATYIFIN